MVDKVLGWIRSITELGLAVIALGVVLQVIFGAAVPFLGLDMFSSWVGKTTRCRRPCRISCCLGTLGYLLKEVIQILDKSYKYVILE